MVKNGAMGSQIPGFWNPMVKNGAMGFSQIPGFWNPMVKNGAMGFFSDHCIRFKPHRLHLCPHITIFVLVVVHDSMTHINPLQ